MLKTKYIVLMGVMMLLSCTSVQVPIDDAYYWPDKSTQGTSTSSTSSPSSSGSSGSSSSTIEYTHVQDTTVTIRIKR